MDYIGEHLLPGKIGHLFIIISLVASLLAAFSYYKSFRSPDPADQASWKRIGRISFFIDAISVIGANAGMGRTRPGPGAPEEPDNESGASLGGATPGPGACMERSRLSGMATTLRPL